MKYSKEIYDKDVFIKACYAFTDIAYLHLSADDKNYYVEIIPKRDVDKSEEIHRKLENELIFQQTRKIVSRRTKSLREMIVARALASTIINEDEQHVEEEQVFSADNILKDWFEENE